MARLADLHLIVYFTKGVSLRAWDEGGLFEREVALYRRLRPRLRALTFVTYGDRRDLAYRDRLDGVEILCNADGLPATEYARRLASRPPADPNRPALLKSNQVWGAEIPLQAARRSGKPFLARCGYLFSDFMERQHGADSETAAQARDLEQTIFNMADRAIVTTPKMQRRLVEGYGVDKAKTQVVPNYVMTDVFKPDPAATVNPRQVCFVGRLNEQKNPFALIRAFRGLDARLAMAGAGALKVRLRREIRRDQLPVDLLGNLPHLELPGLLNQSALFALPSHYEGHPKTLLEAMACGRPIVATDVSGIREEIRHLENGVLCEPTEASLRQAIQRVLDDSDLATRIGRAARGHILERYGLDRIVEVELALYQSLLDAA